MDLRCVIEKEGYRLEDLNPQDQKIIKWLQFYTDDIKQDIENYFEFEITNRNLPTISALKKEIFNSVMEEIWKLAEGRIAEIQVALAENEEE